MFLGGVNFALHFSAIRYRDIGVYFKDSEFKFYSGLLVIISIVSTCVLLYQSDSHDFGHAIREAIFHTVSLATTSGFVTADFAHWPVSVPVLFILSSFIGGCAGSTGGGMKVIRVLLLFKQGQREVFRLIHPNAEVTVKVGKQPVKNTIIDAVWGFFAAYVALFTLIMLLLMLSGVDQITAFSAVAATINNLGPGLGEVSVTYAGLSDFDKLLLCFSMLLGRLEIFTLLVLFTPAFWRK
jgi:trk system potassium uptake protein TrkH